MTGGGKVEELVRQPFWWVQSVFDPDGGGSDFSYTVGLHERGFPELHMWGRPSLGEDPGADWVFGVSDQVRILNQFAARLITGELEVGSVVIDTFDADLTTVTFHVGPASDRTVLEARATHPLARVLPVRWSLSRVPEGESRPLPAEAARRADDDRKVILCQLDRDQEAPAGWEIDWASGPSTFDPGQRYGALTPLVVTRAAQLWQADDEALARALHAAIMVDHAHSLSYSAAVAIAAARPVGRSQALQRLGEDIEGLVAAVATPPDIPLRWGRVVGSVMSGAGLTVEERTSMERGCLRLLRDLVASCLMTDAVSDVAGRDLLLAGRGPWLDAFDRFPHPDRWAQPEVLEAVTKLLRPLGLSELLVLASRHHEAEASRPGAEAYSEVVARLHGWSVVGKARCPWDRVLGSLPGWAPVLAEEQAERDESGWPEPATMGRVSDLHDWATCLTSALVHRERLTDEDVLTLIDPVRDLVPGLPGLLHAP